MLGIPRVGINPHTTYHLATSPWGQVSLEVKDQYGVTTGALRLDGDWKATLAALADAADLARLGSGVAA